jgi:hypothetical protein
MTVPYTFANQTGPIPLLELDQNFAAVSLNVDTAVTVTGNAQPNITSVGILNSLSLGNTIISLGANSSNSGNVFAIAIGANAGAITQRVNAVAIGAFAGGNNQLGNSVAIGRAAGFYNQSANAVAIGFLAGNSYQSEGAIAIGRAAGNSNQASNCIAIGRSAGNLTQGIQAIAIGQNAGNNSQGNQSLAIGAYAGNNNQGANSVAIGSYAGNPLMVANSICINGTAADLSAPNSGFFIAPIRNDNANAANVLYYNTSTKEVTYAPSSAYSNSNVSTFLADFGSNTISTAGNITTAGFFVGTFVGNITGNLVVPGSNTQILYNNDGNAGASTALTFDSASNVLALTGNITASQFTGNGAGLSSIAGANITGVVANATIAGTVTTAAQPNITSVGTLTSLTVNGNATASNLVSTGQVNVLGNVSASGFIGNGSGLSAIPGANIIGLISVTGNIASANLLTGGQVSATGNIITAGLVSVAGNVITDQVVNVSGNISYPYPFSGTTYANNAIHTSNGTRIDIGDTVYGNGIAINDPDLSAIYLTDGNILADNLTLTSNAVVGFNLDILNGNISIAGLEIITYPNYIDVTGSNTYSLSSTTSTNLLRANNTGYTATINMPAGLINGQLTKFTVAGNTITLAAGTGNVSPSFAGSQPAGTGFIYIYDIFTDSWYQTV